ncbi:hypothetical protein [Kitasatospora cineracea]|uniref:hypothetical protein n=1 Tax=Kitasatospora cineracea TaxID=88074 RepID=UPI0038008E55
MTDLISVSFLDLAKVVSVEACGLERSGLADLLYGADLIYASIDALTYAMHELQIRREERCLSTGREDDQTEYWRWQHEALRRRLKEGKAELERQRVAELTRHGLLPAPPPTDEPWRLAQAWLAQYLRAEWKTIFIRHLAAAGMPPAAAANDTDSEKIQCAIACGLITAPLSLEVSTVLALGDVEFRRRVLDDAGRHGNRDDVLCHPVLLHRWSEQLKVLRSAAAPKAHNRCTRTLTPLPWAKLTGMPPGQITQLSARRRLLASLLQRSGENRRLTQSTMDVIAVANQVAPGAKVAASAAQAASEELVRRHPDLYRTVRACLEPYETRYGRIADRDPALRRQWHRAAVDALDRAVEASDSLTV